MGGAVASWPFDGTAPGKSFSCRAGGAEARDSVDEFDAIFSIRRVRRDLLNDRFGINFGSLSSSASSASLAGSNEGDERSSCEVLPVDRTGSLPWSFRSESSETAS